MQSVSTTVSIGFLRTSSLIIVATCFYILFGTITSASAQVGIPAAGVELNGYAWSSNIGWISMNCKTGGTSGEDICATSNYKATVANNGAVTGYAWSSNIGWIRFGGLSDFPTTPGTIAVNARMTGTYPDLTFEGWVRACAGDNMDASCVPTVATSTPTTAWTWSTSGTNTPQGFKVDVSDGIGNSSPIVYGNGIYVALSKSSNDFMTSSDGVTWTLRTVPNMGGPWNALAFGNGAFVAVASGGAPGQSRMIRSTDGINWTNPYPGIQVSWTSITYGNGLFVAIACGTGAGGTCNSNAGTRVVTSPDGITWTQRTVPAMLWNAITYGGGQFVAVSESAGAGNIMTSPDGVTWTSRTGAAGLWNDVEYGNGMYVVTPWSGGANILTSPDGITWTTRTISGITGTLGIIYSNGDFIVPVYYASGGSVFMSKDGVTWTNQSYFIGSNYIGAGGILGIIGAGPNEVVMGSSQNKTTKGIVSTSTPYTGTGWDGWISLRSTSAPVHSVVMSAVGATANSYAWGSNVVGWINFDDVGYLTPTATLSGTNCTIAIGASTCNSSFTWNIQNASNPLLRNVTRNVTYTTNPAGTSTPYAIIQGANTVQTRDDSGTLASIVVTGTCAAGTDFSNGTSCEVTAVPAPVITLTTNKSIARTGDTVQVSWTITPSPLASGSCALTGPGLPASVTSTGSQNSSALKSKTNFTLVCTGAYGTVRANASVEIIPKASEV